MIYKKRRYGIVDVHNVEELAEKLTETWTLCTGFRLDGLLFLNDSTSEDGAQEYAVVRESDSIQLESITFGWCTYEKAIQHIKDCFEIGEPCFGKVCLSIEPTSTHHCRLCA